MKKLFLNLKSLYFRFHLCVFFLALFLLSSCGQSILSISLAPKKIITGRVFSLNGLTAYEKPSSTSLQFLNIFTNSAHASGCRFTDIKLKLYRLNSGVRSDLPEAEGTLLGPDGRYALRTTAELVAKINESSETNYVLDVSGCETSSNYSRQITGIINQDVTYTTSLIANILELDSAKRAQLLKLSPTQLDNFYKRAISLVGTSSSISDAFQSFISNPKLANEFEVIFGFPVTELQWSAPRVLSQAMPVESEEKKNNVYSVTASHWNPSYNISYIWKLDGVVVSTNNNYTYIPTANSQGKHTISLYVGKSDGFVGIDITKPFISDSVTINVANTFLPTPPNFLINGTEASQLTLRTIDLALDTGNSFVNCETFSKLAIRENTNSMPTDPAEFTITCTDAGTQLVPYILSSAGIGQKTLYLWAMDSAGNVSALPAILPIILLGNPDANTSTVTATPFNNVTSDGGTYSFVTITIRDSLANPIPNRPVSLVSARGLTDSIVIVNSSTNVLGEAIFKVASLTPGSSTISATDVNSALNLSQMATITFASGGPSGIKSSLTKNKTSVLADGVSFVTLTATIKDSSSNPLAGRIISISSNRNSQDIISPAQVTTDAFGRAVFTARSTKSGNPLFTVTDVADGIVVNQTQIINFLSGNVSLSKSIITLSTDYLDPGDTAVATITLLDSNGNLIEDTNQSSNLNFTLFNSGTSQGSFSNVTAVVGSPGIYTAIFKAGSGGTTSTVRAYLKNIGVFTSSPSVTVSQRKFNLTGPSSIFVGACSSTITVSYQSSLNIPVMALADKSIIISGTGKGVAYLDSNCITPATTFTLPAGTDSKNLYFKNLNKESHILSVSSAGVISARLNVEITAAPVNGFTLTGPSPLKINSCSPAYTLSAVDEFGNGTAVSTNTLVNLTAGVAGAIYSDPSCANPTNSLTIASGMTSTQFYFKGSKETSFILLASSVGLDSAFLPVTVSPEVVLPLKLILSGSVNPAVNVCNPYDVTSANSSNNPVNAVSSILVSLSASGSGKFYSDAGCTNEVFSATINAATSLKTFYYKTFTSSSYTFLATANNYMSSTLNITTSMISVAKFQISGPLKVTVNTCSSAYTLNPKDQFENIVTASVDLTANLSSVGNISFFSDNACTASISSATVNVGQNFTKFYIKSSAPEKNILRAIDADLLLIGNSYAVISTVGVTTITAGNNHTCAMTTGRVICWGLNDSGQLGNNSINDSAIPVQVQGLVSGVTAISSGGDHSCAIVNGALKCWGSNSNGQLGNNSITNSRLPVQVNGLTSGVTHVSAGFAHTCAIVNGSAVCWGKSHRSQLGNDSLTDRYTPVQVTGLISGVTNIEAGYYSTCAVVNGSAKCWGTNTSGVLGDSSTTLRSSPVQVTGLTSGVDKLSTGGSLTSYHSCAISTIASQSSLMCWGANSFGQIGNGVITNQTSPVQVTGLTSGVTDVSVGVSHTCAIVNGAVKCWGENTNGKLGNGTLTSVRVPTQVPDILSGATSLALGAAHSCAIVDGQVVCWGSNQYGQLGTGTSMRSAIPVEIISSGASEVQLGYNHLCARSSDQVQCWGDNSLGQLGNGTNVKSSIPLVPQTLGIGSQTSAIASGKSYSCAIVNGAIKCWGSGTKGQLGNAHNLDSNIPMSASILTSNVGSITSGSEHACAVKNSAAYCWGENSFGQLGDETTLAKIIPLPVHGLTSGVTQISAGLNHTCAVVSGAAKCWGANISGQVGNGANSDLAIATEVNGLNSGVTKVSSGAYHSCAIVGGAAYCWGSNIFGQLGNDSVINTTNIPVNVTGLTSGVTSIAAGWNYTCAVKDAGAWCWGSNSSGQLGSMSTGQSFIPIQVEGLGMGVDSIVTSVEGSSACALLSNGAVKCWGENSSGQLGVRDTGINYTVQPVFIAPIPTVDSLPVLGGVAFGSKATLSGPTVLRAKICSGLYKVTLKDVSGNIIITGEDKIVTLTGGGSGTIFRDNECLSSLDELTVESGNSSASFYFMDSFTEDVMFSASVEGYQNSSLNVSVTPAASLKLELTGPSAFDTGACSSAFTLKSLDLLGVPTNVTSNVVVSISGNQGGFFYSESSCNLANKLETITLNAGTSSKTIYFKGSLSENFNILLTADGFYETKLSISTLASLPAKIQILGPSSFSVGRCSSAYTATIRDSSGNSTLVTSNTTLQLLANSSAKIYSDATCTTEISSVNVPSGNSLANFYLWGREPESILIIASGSSLIAGIIPIQIVANSAAHLFISGPASLNTGICGNFNLATKDVYGYLTTLSVNQSISLTGKGEGNFYSDENCSTSPVSSIVLSADVLSKTFYFKDLAGESLTLVAKDSNFTNATHSLTSISTGSTKLLFSGAQDISTGVCSTYTLTNADLSNNPIAVAVVDKSITLGGKGSGVFYSNAGCTTSIPNITMPIGVSSKTIYFKASISQFVRMTASASDTITGFLGVKIGVDANKLQVTGPGSNPAGSCSTAYSLNTLNGADVATNVSVTTTVTLEGKGSGKFYSDNNCITAINSINVSAGTNSANFYFKNDVAMSQLFFVSASGFTSSSLAVLSLATSASKLKLSGPSYIAVNTCSPSYSVSAKDVNENEFNFGNNTTLDISGAGINGAFYSDANCSLPISSLNILAGTSGTFYIKSIDSDTDLTLTVADQLAVLGSASLNITVRSVPQYVSTGGSHTCAIKNGALYCWGINTYGQLGAKIDRSATPLLVPGAETGVIGVSSGTNKTCVLYNTGGVKCTGGNTDGDIGNGFNSYGVYALTDVVGLNSGVSKVISGSTYACALLVDQTVKCWGKNKYGQLGDGSLNSSNIPIKIEGLSGVTDIANNYSHLCAIVNSGVLCWGDNDYGQLGDGSLFNSALPINVPGFGPGSGVTKLAMGDGYSCAVKNSGLYCWGRNHLGQLGIGNKVSQLIPSLVPNFPEGFGVSDISAGVSHTCAIANGGLYCWGANSSGQLGKGDLENRISPVLVIDSGVSQVSLKISQTCAIVYGVLKCWGENSEGQLGTGVNFGVNSPVDVASFPAGSGVTSVEAFHKATCAIVSGSLSCWGRNTIEGLLGNGGSADSLIPVQVTGLSSGVTMTSGSYHLCAVVNGGANCWGLNTSGQLGNATTVSSNVPVVPVGLTANSGVTKIANSRPQNFTCAVVNNGVQCWGDNKKGQLGDGTKINRLIPTQVSGLPAESGVISVDVGDSFGCALLNDGTVKCWGENLLGQLGDGTSTDSLHPVDVINLSRPAVAISLGNDFGCAILDTGAVQCWGKNSSGKLGSGDFSDTYGAIDVLGLSSGVTRIDATASKTCAVVNGGVKCWGSSGEYIYGGRASRNFVPTIVPELPEGSGVTEISNSGDHVCVVINGGIKCWGKNDSGQLGDLKPVPNPSILKTPGNVLPF